MGLLTASSSTVNDFLAANVIFEKEIAQTAAPDPGGYATLIYVLGGNQDSLLPRFERASALYHRGIGRKIHILSRPGITEFSANLRRNLTNDEWSSLELEKLGVRRGDVIAVPVEPSFFGTIGEARSVSGIARKERYRRLVLVSSQHHTRRSYESFRRFLRETPMEIYVYGSRGLPGFRELVLENLKRIAYEYVVLPWPLGEAERRKPFPTK